MRKAKKHNFEDAAKAKRKKMLDKMKEELEIKRQMDQEESSLGPSSPQTP